MVQQALIGSWRDVEIHVAAWDGVGAAVDLSCACMFTHEVTDASREGLAHLDATFGGALVALRHEGHFAAEPLDILLVTRPPRGVAGSAVLLIGLGDPGAWSGAVTARAAATAVRCALQLQASSAAFAPSMLEGGVDPDADVSLQLMRAVTGVLDTQARLTQLGLATGHSLRTWYFDVGAPRFGGAVESFRTALKACIQRAHPA